MADEKTTAAAAPRSAAAKTKTIKLVRHSIERHTGEKDALGRMKSETLLPGTEITLPADEADSLLARFDGEEV